MASATGTKQQQHPHPAPPPGAAVVDPKFEWAEKAGSYVLRLTLQGFKKDDFRVQVDGAGRLTVRGTRPGASLHKVFQLPAAAILDNIAGRFEAGVLTLTVPKRAGANKGEIAPKMAPTEQVDGAMKTGDAGGENKAPKAAPSTSSAVAPTSVEEIRAKPKEEGAKKMPTMDDDDEKEGVTDVEPKESVLSRTARLVAEQVQRMEEAANRRKQEQQKPAPAAKKEQEIVEVKPKAPQTAAATMTPAPKPTLGEKSKAVVEEERAKAATAATSMEARAKHEKKATATTFTAWKGRMTEGLGQLTDMKWADGAVEMARKNKEVVAVGIAAFSLGFFISHRFFRK